MHALDAPNPPAPPSPPPSSDTRPLRAVSSERSETGRRSRRACERVEVVRGREVWVHMCRRTSAVLVRDARASSSCADSANDATCGTRGERVGEDW